MTTLFPAEDYEQFVILSASRMTDMPKYYPIGLIKEVRRRLENGQKIHTLVLWTKHPMSLLTQPLMDFLIELKSIGIQIYLQLTITGLGGIPLGFGKNNFQNFFEPNSPKYEDSLTLIPDIINLLGKPERIRIRIDPIIRIIDSERNILSNLNYLPIIIEKANQFGVSTFSFSFLERSAHKKVDKRFADISITIFPPDDFERNRFIKWVAEIEKKHDVQIFSCCVPGMKISKCIDGSFLESIHDHQIPTEHKQPYKRKLCGCTESIDIGGWPPKRCFTGCLYCYSNPVIS